MAPAEITPLGIFAAASALILFLVVCVGLFRGEYKFRVAPVIKRKIQAERQEHPIPYRFGMALIIVFALGMAAVAIYELVGPLGPFGLSG